MAKKKIKLSLPEKMIKFIETLVSPSGDSVGTPIRLMEFQRQMIREVYGPMNDKGERITSEAILTIARKNGKTSLCAAIALCHIWLPDLIKVNQEILILAYTRDQAGNLFRAVQQMILMDSELCHDFNIMDSRKIIKHKDSGGFIRIESAEAASIMGSNPSCVFFDEIGSFPAEKAREVYSAVTTGFGARRESMVWVLSTQAASDIHIFSEKIAYGRNVNSGEIIDPGFKAFIYEIGKDEDVYDESNWIKSNPGIGVIRSREEMQKKANEAKQLPAMEPSFRQLFGNQMVEAHSPLFSRGLWVSNQGQFNLEKLEGRVCYGGLDLSAKSDLTSLVLVFPTDDEIPKLHLVPFFWKPLQGLREASLSDRVPYEDWQRRGFLECIPGPVISYDWVAQRIADLSLKFKIQGIGFDRWRINEILSALKVLGFDLPLSPIGQGWKDMNPCVEIFEQLLLEKRIIHNGNPVMTWNISNAVVDIDPSGSRKPTKSRSYGRIDGVVAAIMAARIWELTRNNAKSCYDDPAFIAYMTGSA